MVVIVDDNKNIPRIIDVLKADIAVFELNKKNKAREILFGDPADNVKQTNLVKPYIYVTTADSLQLTSRPFGVASDNIIHQTTTSYQIVVVADTQSGTVDSQKQLYEIIKNTKIALETDPTFSDPQNPGADKIFLRSVINDMPWDSETRGQRTTSVTLILTATIGIEQGITIPGVGFLAILGITPDSDTENWQPHFNTAMLLKGYAPLGNIRTIAVLVIYKRTEIEAIRALKLTRAELDITFTDTDGTNQILTAVISNIDTSMANVEDIKTTAIQFNII